MALRNTCVLVQCLILGVLTVGLQGKLTIKDSVPIRDPRVLEGTEATQEQFRYVASLRHEVLGHLCTLTILDENSVITAKRCGTEFENEMEKLSVVAGVTDLEYGSSAERKKVTNFRYPTIDELQLCLPPFPLEHEYMADIVLMKVDPPFVYDGSISNVSIVESPPDNVTLVNCTLVGWGGVQEGDGISRYLHYVDVPIFPNCSICDDKAAPVLCVGNLAEIYNASVEDKPIPPRRGAGLGDLGSPLICDGPGMDEGLLGIYTFTFRCTNLPQADPPYSLDYYVLTYNEKGCFAELLNWDNTSST